MPTEPNQAEPSAPVADGEELTKEQLWDELRAEEADPVAQERHEDAPEAEDAAPDAPSEDGPAEPGATAPDAEDTVEALKAQRDALREQNERLRHGNDSEKGRSRALRQQIDELKARIAATETSVASVRTDDDKARARRDNLAKAKADYGDVVGPVADILAEIDARTKATLTRDETLLAADRRQLGTLFAENEAAFKAEHPDGFDVIEANAPVFREWIEDQPKQVRDIFQANANDIVDPTGAALLVTLFKQSLLPAETASPPPSRPDSRRQRQLDGARATRSGSQPRTTSEPAKDSEDKDALWDYWARQDREAARR